MILKIDPYIISTPINFHSEHTTMKKTTHQKVLPSDSYVTNQALKGITKIVPFFHRIKLSSKELDYNDLNEIFPGKIHQPNNSKVIAAQRTGGMYKNFAWLWIQTKKGSKNHQIGINYNPIKPYYPECQLNISDPTVEILAYLNQKTSKLFRPSSLKVASVEYTIDFYCRNSTDVGNLFYVFRRNYFSPHAKKTYLKGGYFNGYSHKQDYSTDRDSNAVFFIDFSNKHTITPSKRVKFYERGDDQDKLLFEQYWSHDKCDRVRYEATITTHLLRKINIKYIKDFLINPNFRQLIFPSDSTMSLFQFKQFSKKQYRKYVPPNCDQDYYHKDKDIIHFECFIDEANYAKSHDLDLSNSLEKYSKLDELIIQTEQRVKQFEIKWIKKGKIAINWRPIDTNQDDNTDNSTRGKRLKEFYK